MKLLKNFSLLLLFIAIAVSCGKDKEDPATEVKKVTLEASATEISVGEVCKFTVKADGKDVTGKAEVYQEGISTPLAAKEFKSDKEGSYQFYAKYDGKTSEKITVKVVKDAVDEGTLILSASSTQLQLNETCTFTVKLDDNDVTANAEIFNVEASSPLSAKEFKSDKEGSYQFYAKYDGKTSEKITVKVVKDAVDEGTLILSASSTQLQLNETCTFTVKLDDNDVTANAEIFNVEASSPLSAKEFKSDKEGSYQFYAKYDGKTSATITITVTKEEAFQGNVRLGASTTSLIADGESSCTFTVLADNKDVTTDSKIYSQDTGDALESNVFTPKAAGTFKFYAVHKGKKSSNEVTINVKAGGSSVLPVDPQPENYSFKHRVTAFFFTGLWCPYCPRGMAAIKDIESKPEYAAEKEKVSFVEVHCEQDQLALPTESRELIGVNGGISVYPSICFNMDKSAGSVSETSALKFKINTLSAVETNAGLSAAVVKDGTSLLVYASVKASAAGKYGVGAFLVEDKITATQQNRTTLKTYNFNEHENVLRALYGRNSSSDYSGDIKEVGAQATASYAFSIKGLQSSWNLENCRVVVYVTDASTKRIINSTICNIDGTVEFQYK